MLLRAWIIGFLLPAVCVAEPLSVDHLLRRTRGAAIADRIDSASVQLLGVPFLEAPLGEGPGSRYDAGPLSRLDGFDCTTFVETVLALARSRAVREFEKTLIQIRYRGGKVGFAQRNHFPCVDWIPENTRQGVVTDITATIGAPWGIEHATGEIRKREWAAKLPLSVIRAPGISETEKAKRLGELVEKFREEPPTRPSLAYIPLTKFISRKAVAAAELARRAEEEKEFALTGGRFKPMRSTQSETSEVDPQLHNELVGRKLKYLIQDTEVDPKLLTAIPSGTILNVVKPNWKITGTELNVSHQGFVIQKPDAAYFRHVSKSTGRTKDVLLANYLRLCLLMPAIKGINLLQPNG